MNNTGLKVLKELEASGSMTLEEIANLLPKRHGNHKDFYILASLVTSGFIDDDLLIDPERPNPNQQKAGLRAEEFYACSTADQKAEYRGKTWSRFGGTDGKGLKEQELSITGKGSLYLAEYRSRRSDRIFTLASGILIGILVAVIGAYAREYFDTPIGASCPEASIQGG